MSLARKFHPLTSRDRQILTSLWKWKLGTTASIGEEFFNGARTDAAHSRLRILHAAGYVEPHRINGNLCFGWTLGPAGYAALRSTLPVLREDGYRSETLWHDYWCTVLQRGPWIAETPSWVEQVSEQELRRVHAECLPRWVPRTTGHRPDGYLRLATPAGERVLAFEAELTRKRLADYVLVAHFYQYDPGIDAIVWLLPSKTDAAWLRKALSEAAPATADRHHFLVLQDFVALHWHATFSAEPRTDLSILKLMPEGAPPIPLTGETPSLMNTWKRPYRANSSADPRSALDLDRVVLLPTRPSFFPNRESQQ